MYQYILEPILWGQNDYTENLGAADKGKVNTEKRNHGEHV